jgi:CBS-domain-containing membrane protein
MSIINFFQAATKSEGSRNYPMVGDVLLSKGDNSCCLEVEPETTLLEIEKRLVTKSDIKLILVRQPHQNISGIITLKKFYQHLTLRVAPACVIKKLLSEHSHYSYLECVSELTALDIMQKPVLLQLENTLTEVFDLMQENDTEILPVMGSKGELVNCLHLHDLISYWANHCPDAG